MPTLCHDDRLVPTGACRSCLVRVCGREHLVPACATPVTDGMVVETRTPELVAHRRAVIGLMAARYPARAASDAPEQEFHRALRYLSADGGAAVVFETPPEASREPLQDRSHRYIAVDMSRCINCDRCVRICDEVQGEQVWHVRGRGIERRIAPDGPTLAESSCVACGACVDTCPTGALADAAHAPGPPLRWTRTTCPYCGTGCEMRVGVRDDRIVTVRPVLDAPVSKGHLCVKGRYAFDFVHADDRITDPMIRDHGAWRRTSWSDALAFIARRLRDVIDRHGPDSVGVLGSARATNEDNYVVQKFARTVIGTHNVDCCARVCHAPSAAALKQMLGAGMATNSFDDIERAGVILVCGANPIEDHPIVGARIRQAARRGTRLIVIDPRRIELADDADCHLAIKPGTNVALLNAMANVILTEDLCDRAFLESRVAGVEAFRRFLADWSPERAARICQVEPDAIRQAARLYAGVRPALTLHGLGLTEHVQGTDGVMALINLALVTGNLGKPGAGVNPLRGQNNVQGAAHMGCDPALLTGGMPVELGREAFERQWQGPLPRTPGLNLMGMLDAAVAGNLQALWAIGYDVFLTNPNAAETARALRSLDLVIVQDLFCTETAREFGTVFLPACSSFEKEGTFMNAERRIQRVRAALPALGHSKPDWSIVSEVARALGAPGFDFRSPREIWDEVRALCPGAWGMTYARLDEGGLQWPCPDEGHPGTPTLHTTTFAGRQRALLQCLDARPPSAPTTDQYPFLLVTGRSLFQFNAGTMTGRTGNQDLRPTDTLDISPSDAATAGVEDGERVRIVSGYGAAELPARVSARILPGQLFATFHSPAVFLNSVTGPHRDSVAGTPEYKVTAVRVERIAQAT